MYGKTTVIPFPGAEERAARADRVRLEAKAKADALPETLRELEVAWIFEEAARRDARTHKPK